MNPLIFFFWKTYHNPGVCTQISIHENQEQIVIKKKENVPVKTDANLIFVETMVLKMNNII